MSVRKTVSRVLFAGVLGFGVVAVSPVAPAQNPTGVDGATPGLRVPAKGSDTHTLTLRKGVRVNITARGDGDTDIDLFVYDPNGRLVAKDDDTTDICIVAFTPEETGVYQLKITNLGNVYNEYKLEIK